MAIINIDFSGFIQVEHTDLKISVIDENTGFLEPVDVSTLTPEETIEGIKTGKYYINFEATNANAIDGQNIMEASIED